MLFGLDAEHIYIMEPAVIHFVKICWLLCLREALCFCAGAELHAWSFTCSVTLLATVPRN